MEIFKKVFKTEKQRKVSDGENANILSKKQFTVPC